MLSPTKDNLRKRYWHGRVIELTVCSVALLNPLITFSLNVLWLDMCGGCVQVFLGITFILNNIDDLFGD